MKNLIMVICLIFCGSSLWAQPNLEIVWQKDIFPGIIEYAKFSADGKFIYCASGGNIHKMDAMTGEFVGKFENTGVTNSCYYFTASNESKYLITLNPPDYNLWDTKLEKVIKRIQLPEQTENQKINTISFCSDSKTIILQLLTYTKYNGIDKITKIEIIKYDFIEDKIIDSTQTTYVFQKLQCSQDGKTFVTGSVYEDLYKKTKNILILWDAETLNQIKVIEDVEGLTMGYTKLRYSPKDKFIAFTKNSYTILYDLVNFNVVKSFANSSNFNFLPKEDGFLAANVQEKKLNVFNLLNEKVQELPVYASILEVFTNDEKTNYFCCSVYLPTLLQNKTLDVGQSNISSLKIDVTLEKIFIYGVNQSYNDNTLKILDLAGNELLNIIFELNQNKGLIINNTFPTGTYFCIIKSGNQEYSQKFQVVR